MENTAFDTLVLGVNIFVFVLALTLSITLMVNLLEITSSSNDILNSNTQGSLYETVSKNKDRVYDLSDILKYREKYDATSAKYKIEINNAGVIKNITDPSYEIDLTKLAIDKYHLIYSTDLTSTILTFQLI